MIQMTLRCLAHKCSRRAILSLAMFDFLTGGIPVLAQELAVVSRAADALVFHDIETGSESGRVAVGDFPHEVALNAAGSHAYVASYGGDTIHAIDLRTRQVRAFRFEEHEALHGVAVSREPGVFWVTAEKSGAVLEIDEGTGEIVRAWPTHGNQSHMAAATPDGRKLYVADLGSDAVSVIDRIAGTTTRVSTGAGPEGVEVSPDGAETWVSNRDDNTVSVIDTTSDRVVATFSSGGVFPVKLRFRPDGREVWIANNRSASIAVFDGASRELVGTIRVGERPLGIAFSADSRTAYVTRPGDNEILEIETPTRTIRRRLKTAGSPDGLVWVDEN
jgi:YVTN family beta-propeller protein